MIITCILYTKLCAGEFMDCVCLAPAPYTPEIASEADTSNFEEFDPKPSENNAAGPVNSSALAVHLPFVGFTYTHNRYVKRELML